jgi:hypothetical protein
MTANDDMEAMWKEAVVIYFELLPKHLPEWTEENHKEFHDSRSLDCDSIEKPPEREAEMLTTQPQTLSPFLNNLKIKQAVKSLKSLHSSL